MLRDMFSFGFLLKAVHHSTIYQILSYRHKQTISKLEEVYGERVVYNDNEQSILQQQLFGHCIRNVL